MAEYLVQLGIRAVCSNDVQSSIHSKLFPTVCKVPANLRATSVCNLINLATPHVRAERHFVCVVQIPPAHSDCVNFASPGIVETKMVIHLNTTVLQAGVPSCFTVASCKNLACLTDELFFKAVSSSPRHAILKRPSLEFLYLCTALPRYCLYSAAVRCQAELASARRSGQSGDCKPVNK